MKIRGVIVIFCILGMLVGCVLLMKEIQGLCNENIQLKKQLELYKTEVGRLIGIEKLPDGRYMIVDNPHYTLVQMKCDFPVGPVGPVLAVSASDKLPSSFVIKDGHTSEGVRGWNVRQDGAATTIELR